MGLFDRSPRSYRSSSANSLTGAGERVKKREADAQRRLTQPWQSRSFAYYDLLSEVNYASLFYSRALSVLRLFAGERDEHGVVTETENPVAIEQLERIQDPGGGGRSGLLGAYGRLVFLVGEAQLFVSKNEETEREQWEMLSADEIRPQPGGGYQRIKAPALTAEMYRQPEDDDYEPISDQSAVVYRLWRRHPRYSALATSTMASVLDICEELVLLTQAVRARARSRLAGSGILVVNGRYIPAPPEAVADENIEEDPFMRDLIDAMTAPLINEGTASAVVPHVVRVDVDKEQKIDEVMKHIQIVDPMQLYPETGLRMECIKRLAIGLDMPPEILLGMTDANHWSAWVVDDQTWTAHLQPVAQQLVDDLTASFFQPTLRQENVPDWDKYVIGYDNAAVVNNPDRSKDARDAHNAGVIGDKALRDAIGFEDEDAPTEEERRVWISIKSRDPQFAMTGVPTPKPEAGQEDAPEAVEPPEDDDGAADRPGGSGAETRRGPPEEPEDDAATASADLGPVGARVIGAADLALHRARELAGARLRSLAKRDAKAEQAIDGVRPAKVAATLGRDLARKIRAPSERELVSGIRDSLAEALQVWGVDEALAEPLGARVEQHAARTLFDEHPAPLPQSFENYVKGLGLDRPAVLA